MTKNNFLFQLCCIDHGIAGADEIEKLKTFDSVYLEFQMGIFGFCPFIRCGRIIMYCLLIQTEIKEKQYAVTTCKTSSLKIS